MKLKQFLADDGAVSPVIGVILMVAITVILAAVIGTFVLGLGDQVGDTQPNAQWSWEQTDVTGHANYGSGTYQTTVTHEGGQDVAVSQVSLTVSNSNVDTEDPKDTAAWNGLDTDSNVAAGASFSVVDTSVSGFTALSEGDEVRILWRSADGGTSSTLTTHEV